MNTVRLEPRRRWERCPSSSFLLTLTLTLTHPHPPPLHPSYFSSSLFFLRDPQISSTLYDTLMPLVKEQVRSQIKVCDLSRMSVEIHPADFASWSAASESLTREAVAPIKAEQRRALKRADGDQTAVERINAEFAERIETEQAAVASTPLEIHLEVSTDYNFL